MGNTKVKFFSRNKLIIAAFLAIVAVPQTIFQSCDWKVLKTAIKTYRKIDNFLEIEYHGDGI